MALIAHAAAVLDDTRQAFDGVAGEYHAANAANPMLAAMRTRVIETVRAHVPAGSRLLDLGCGPGTDEDAFARAGYLVTAIDWSPAMVAEAERRVAALQLGDRVQVYRLGIHELDRLPEASADAACSNFGPLNCVPDLQLAATLIGRRLKPGGVLVASVIGRRVPWEIVRYGLGGDWERVRVRFTRGFVPVPLNGRRVWTHYYTPREFERVFTAAGFTRVSVRALGLLVPPPYMDAFGSRHPRLMAALQRIEDAIGGWPLVRCAGDHFMMVLRWQ